MKHKLKYTVYCFLEHGSRELPDIRATRKEVIESNTSYHGHPCDDPRKRGIVCRATLTLEVGKVPLVTQELIDYHEQFSGDPGIMDLSGTPSADAYNQAAQLEAQESLKRTLKSLRRAK